MQIPAGFAVGLNRLVRPAERSREREGERERPFADADDKM
jgi:hypothetical protein